MFCDLFTGIIEEVGKVLNVIRMDGCIKLCVGCSEVLNDTKIGDSISVNGVCLTVVKIFDDNFVADVMKETIKSSSLGMLKLGDVVNLERAMTLNKRLGGHIVTGHIDGVGNIIHKKGNDRFIVIGVGTTSDIIKYIVKKGSVSLDGISLTVSNVYDKIFEVSIIPHTMEQTNLISKNIGDVLNIECDVIGKYVERFSHGVESGITYEFLNENGFY